MTGIDPLRVLHDDVSNEAARIARLHGERLRCRRGCHDCCVDELTVFRVEAETIRRHHAELLENGKPHAAGGCAFLDPQGACRIYEHRPYVCRTQGLPLRWFDHDEHGETVEYRDICPLNEPGEPALTELAADACWTIGAWEARLAELQTQQDQHGERIALRALFQAR